MTLGDKLSRLRKENNYTQEQLADVLGVSRQAISKWESNITYPETDKLVRMSKLFIVRRIICFWTKMKWIQMRNKMHLNIMLRQLIRYLLSHPLPKIWFRVLR